MAAAEKWATSSFDIGYLAVLCVSSRAYHPCGTLRSPWRRSVGRDADVMTRVMGVDVARHGKTAPYWKRIRPLGIGFLGVGILLWVLDRLIDGPFMAGMGPGFVVGGVVVLAISLVSWWGRPGNPPEAGE